MNQAPTRGLSKRRQYLLGLVLGLIPLLLFWSSNVFSSCLPLYYACSSPQPSTPEAVLEGILTALSLASYGVAAVAQVVLLAFKQTRTLGYGLLTMVLVSPIVAPFGCVVIESNVHF